MLFHGLQNIPLLVTAAAKVNWQATQNLWYWFYEFTPLTQQPCSTTTLNLPLWLEQWASYHKAAASGVSQPIDLYNASKNQNQNQNQNLHVLDEQIRQGLVQIEEATYLGTVEWQVIDRRPREFSCCMSFNLLFLD